MSAETLIVSVASRFWNGVDRSAGATACWPWKGGKPDGCGYGRFGIGKEKIGTHRVALALSEGVPVEGLCVLHSCDNPICCNPSHLRVGTHQENVKDRNERNRQARGENNGRCLISEETARAIIEQLGLGKMPAQVSREMGIAKSIVTEIKRGRNWKHLPRPASLRKATQPA